MLGGRFSKIVVLGFTSRGEVDTGSENGKVGWAACPSARSRFYPSIFLTQPSGGLNLPPAFYMIRFLFSDTVTYNCKAHFMLYILVETNY